MTVPVQLLHPFGFQMDEISAPQIQAPEPAAIGVPAVTAVPPLNPDPAACPASR